MPDERDPMGDAIRKLPRVEAPESLWKSIEASLDQPAPRPLVRGTWRGFRARAALAFAFVTIAIALALGWRETRPAKPQWEVVRLDGTPSVGSKAIGDSGRIAEGQWLQTDAASRARIRVGEIGTVQVEPNTRVRLVAARPNEHRLALARGEISAIVTAPPRLFFVDTASSTAVDLGCAYTMKMDDSGAGLLRVTLGWVSLEWSGRESLVPAGASCRTRPRIGPGTPYFDDAPERLQQAVADFDFGNGGADALGVILARARVRDTLTLWHLLSRVNAGDRVRVFDRMAALVRFPDAMSRERVLKLDREALDQWKDELILRW